MEFNESMAQTDKAKADEAEELELEESLTPLQRVTALCAAEGARNRLNGVREMEDVMNGISVAEIESKLMPLLREAVGDVEPIVRQGISQHFAALAKVYVSKCQSPRAALDVISTQLLPVLEKLLRDLFDPQVREHAVASFSGLAVLAAQKCKEEGEVDVGEFFNNSVMDIISRIAKSAELEEQVVGAELLGGCATTLGRQLLLEHFKLIEDLGNNPMFRVRKIVARALGEIAKVIGSDDAIEKIMPLLRTLCEDKIWRVRKECCATLVPLSEALPISMSAAHLIPLFEQFCNDSSRWVRTAAYSNLGRFIATFDSESVTPSMLKLYTDMIHPKNKAQVGDPFITEFCSYSFPAVIFTIGKERWDEVRECFHGLSKDPQWKVRRTLAFSIHEVARIIGTERTEAELIDVFDMLFSDLDLVRVGVIRNLASFVEVVSPEKRAQFLHNMAEIEGEEENWRYRKYLAKQLAHMSDLLPEHVETSIFPIALRFCFDQVAKVRKYAVKEIGLVVRRIENKEPFFAQLLEKGADPSCYNRQIFAEICGEMFGQVDQKLLVDEVLPRFLQLAKDPVPNVRLAVGKVITQKLMSDPGWDGHKKDYLEALTPLKEDKDSDVSFFASLKPAIS